MNLDYFIAQYKLLPEVLIGTILLYTVLMLYTRIFGLKSFSKMSTIDFALTIAIGSMIASTIATGSPSLVIGITAVGLMFFLKYFTSWLKLKSNRFEKAAENTPVMLMFEGEVLYEQLRASRVTEDELRGKLREANVIRLSQVKAVILETTGDVSVLHSDEKAPVDAYLLEDVKNSGYPTISLS
jgi:uncharacterized membrane protein YcaP (DUF421 family)